MSERSQNRKPSSSRKIRMESGLRRILGVGEARYKRAYCDRSIPMIETHLALTPAGAILSATLRAQATAKRWIKQRPGVRSMIRRAR